MAEEGERRGDQVRISVSSSRRRLATLTVRSAMECGDDSESVSNGVQEVLGGDTDSVDEKGAGMWRVARMRHDMTMIVMQPKTVRASESEPITSDSSEQSTAQEMQLHCCTLPVSVVLFCSCCVRAIPTLTHCLCSLPALAGAGPVSLHHPARIDSLLGCHIVAMSLDITLNRVDRVYRPLVGHVAHHNM